jgi:tetratricopeptide (TPR) repeat protein
MPRTARGRRASLRGPIIATVLAVVYAAVALANGADRIAATKEARALRFPRALAVESLGLAGERAIADARYDDALAIARSAVARAPIEPSSTALLGAAWLAKGDEDRAREAFTVAGKLGWRVPLTQAYWMRAALEAEDARIAALRLDALLRQQPALLAEDRLFAPIEATAEGRAALVSRLATRPPWLADYVNDHGAASREAMLRRAAVLLMLAATGQRLGCDMIRPAVVRLVVLNEPATAQQVWRAHCGNAPMPQA